MGLFSIAETLVDMGKMSKLTTKLKEVLDPLEEEGKLPEELKEAYNKFKAADTKEGVAQIQAESGEGNVSASLEPVKQLISALDKYKDQLPDNVKSVVSQFGDIEGKVEGLAEKVLGGLKK